MDIQEQLAAGLLGYRTSRWNYLYIIIRVHALHEARQAVKEAFSRAPLKGIITKNMNWNMLVGDNPTQVYSEISSSSLGLTLR